VAVAVVVAQRWGVAQQQDVVQAGMVQLQACVIQIRALVETPGILTAGNVIKGIQVISRSARHPLGARSVVVIHGYLCR
jgi:hypothetical protein